MAHKEKKKSKSKTSANFTHEEVNYDTKKPSMKTATDVISRLLWDDSLPQEKFIVGYIDRFDGIVEKPFTALDWNDPAVVDNHSLALPKHRIQYFKYKNRKVWDKTTRKDFIFGSTGQSLGIHEFMAAVDQEQLDFWEEGFVIPKNVTCSENSDDVNNEDNEEYDMSNRANFFIAARIKNAETIKNLKEVSDYMKERDELLSECCILPELYHLTLCVLKLDSPSDVVDALSAIKRVASQYLPLVTLNLDGLDNFRQRVLYARVKQNDDIFNLRKHLVDELVENTITDKFSFVPHVTITKLSRPICRLRNSNYIDQYLYLKFEDDEFGSDTITDLYLCEMGSARAEDGFYKCAGEVSLNQNQSTDILQK